MKNKIAGTIIIGIAILIGFIIFAFNNALTEITSLSCSEGPTCPMWKTIDAQTNISIGILVFVIGIGLYLIFFGKEEKVVTKVMKIKEQLKAEDITKENYEKILSKLDDEDKKVLEMVIDAKGSLMQSDIVSKMSLSKVKVTRILDRLEGMMLIERKRRGMTNIVILRPAAIK
ncbi:MarR family transcriptional regulator [Candidatus Woesearchaeota archaeon]|nr:MarR family transcriptional regulator [Candidatus Woesearchaeota archaeon]